MSIAVVGYSADTTMRHFLHGADSAAAPFVPLEEFVATGHVEEGNDTARLWWDGGRAEISRTTNVYQRIVYPQRSFYVEESGYWRALMVSQALTAVLERIPELVVNRTGAGWHNSAKLFHTISLHKHGFVVPRSLCTADGGSAHRFLSEVGRAVYKSNSGRRSIVRELTVEALRSRGTMLSNAPVLFQEYVAGDDVRVHMLKGEAYGVRAVTDATDYRYARRLGFDVSLAPELDLPEYIVDLCRSYCDLQRLTLAGFDFRVDADKWVCLEVNPSPAFEVYDHVLGGAIRAALVQYLCVGPAGRHN